MIMARRMAASRTRTVQIDAELLERACKVADERGVAVPQLVNTALERELGSEEPQPAFSLIGAFTAGRSDLGARASRDAFEPRPFR
jgi:hypothetical protein